MKKLTKTQEWVLDEMFAADGGEMTDVFNGTNGDYMIPRMGSGISVKTLDVLEKAGYVEQVVRGYKLRLTDAGRAYVQAKDIAQAEPAAIAANVSAASAPAGDYVTVANEFTADRVRRELRTREATLPAIEGVEYFVEAHTEKAHIEVAFADHLTNSQQRDLTALFAMPRVKVEFWNGARGYLFLYRTAPAPDAAQTAAAGDAELHDPEWVAQQEHKIAMATIAQLERELEAVKQMFDGYQTAARETEQALTRELEAARTEAAVLRAVLKSLERERDLLRELILGITDPVNNYSPMEGLTKVYELKNRAASIVRVNVVQLTTSELFPADAALASARQRADSGARTSADDVLAMFADDDAAVLERFKFKVGDKVFIAREANTALCNGIIQQAQRDAYKCTIDRVFQSIAGVELYTVRYGNATDDFSEDELIEAQS